MNHLMGINVSEFDFIQPKKVFEPEDVQSIKNMLLAHRGAEFAPLRVVSTGYNWGLGSTAYSEEDSDLISLHKLNKIREINLDLGYAVIEAGVTQEQLSLALLETDRFLNCTASSAKSSVVGNMMDRGVGLHGQRTEDLLGIEVILADGTQGTVGWWPGEGALAKNPLGLGPSSLHLFTQSNLGVVTAAAIKIRPRPTHREIVSLTVESNAMPFVIERIRHLVRDEVLSGVTKIYDSESSSIYGANDAKIVVHACIDGPSAIIDMKISELFRELEPARPIKISSAEVASDPLMSAVKKLYYGDTSGNEGIVNSTLNTSSENADIGGEGWIFALPFIPLRSEDVINAIDIARRSILNKNVRVGTTINVLNYDTVDLVIALSFPRKTKNIQEAHAAFDILVKSLVGAGYAPYRVDSRHKRNDYYIGANGIDAEIAKRIKATLDPQKVFSYGRYANK